MQKLKLTKKYEKYPEYKDSGVEWIGKIPKGWGIDKLKNKFNFEKGKKAAQFTQDYVGNENNIGCYPVYSGQTENNGVMGSINSYEYDFDSPVIFTTTVGAKAMTPLILKGKFNLSQNCLLMIPKKEEVISSFFFYQLFSLFKSMKDEIPSHMQPSLRFSDLNKSQVVNILSRDQEKIANYLDQKISSIDQIIEKKQKMIELLKEKRTAVINHAVTKGLNSKVEFIESGIEWIGKMPKGWKLDKVKRVAEVLPSNIDKLSVKDELPVRLCNYTDVYKNRSIVSGMIENLMTATATENQIRKLSLQKDDVIITKDSETPDDIGIPAYVPETLTGVVCGYHLAIIRPYKICGAYLNYFFLSKMAKTQFFMAANGLTRYALGISDIGMTIVPLPSKDEQEKIANYLDEKINTFDNAIRIAEKSVQILQEFKTSLISSAVTGKIKIN